MYKDIDSNKTKSVLLIGFFIGLVITAGWFFSYYYNSPGILYFAIGLALVQSIASYWWSDKISLALSGAKETKRKEYLELYRIVENLSITAGLPKPRIYVINDPSPNAFATGRDPKHAAVAVTTGIIERLNKTELQGVIAHEMSHIGNRDTLVMTITVVLVSIIAILSDWFIRIQWFGGGRRDNREGGNAVAILGLVFMILVPIIAQLVQLAVSRKREYLADATGALMTRYPEGLASALEKISADSNQLRRASSATAHLYIASPFKGSKMVNWFSTHPPINDRIAKLRAMISK